EGEIVLETTAYVAIIPATDVDYVSHNYLAGNKIYNNEWTGINIWKSQSNYLIDNYISENSFVGVLIDQASYNILDMNTISFNSEQGIWIGNSEFNELTNNQIVSNGADSGLNLYYSNNHFVSGNTITNNYFGILLEESNSNNITGNNVCDNDGSGIQLMGTSSDNTILGNTIHHNAYGIFIDSYTEVQMRFWQDITATDVDFISWQASLMYESEDEVLNDYALWEVVLTVDGEQVEVWFSGIYYDDRGDPDWPYPWRFDINYYTDPLPVGEHYFHVEFYLDGILQEEWTSTPIVTVIPATVENYASHNSIIGNDIFDFVWMGINLQRAHYNYIEENTISVGLSGNEVAGIRLEGSTFNTITKNIAFSCKYGGVMLVRFSDNNIVDRNELFGSGWSGIFIGTSSFNEISHNILYGNVMNGVFSVNSNSNEYRSNRIFANPIGINFLRSSDSIITRNILTSNAETGIKLDDSSGNSITRNIVLDSANAGIALLGGSNDNNVLRNIIKGSYFGIILDGTSFNNIYRNIVNNCEFGIVLESSTENLVSRNVVFDNEEGIFLSYSSNNRISRNIVFCNGIGIHLVESSDNTIFRNIVFRNDEDFLEEP
ncbi:MAG: NosD domain-containing protein, partial [Candidatus Kariarchaeaceae archaeon]